MPAMCRSIKVLRGMDPPATSDDVQAAALQFVRKISGFHRPSAAHQPAFERAVDRIAAISKQLLDEIHSNRRAVSRTLEARI